MAIKTQTDAAIFPLPAAVLRDLLDHDLDTLEVARRHDLDPAAVRAAVRSDAFRQAAESMRGADQARTAAVWPSIQARAIHRLARIANQPTDSPTQTESARVRPPRPHRSAQMQTPGRHPRPRRHGSPNRVRGHRPCRHLP